MMLFFLHSWTLGVAGEGKDDGLGVYGIYQCSGYDAFYVRKCRAVGKAKDDVSHCRQSLTLNGQEQQCDSDNMTNCVECVTQEHAMICKSQEEKDNTYYSDELCNNHMGPDFNLMAFEIADISKIQENQYKSLREQYKTYGGEQFNFQDIRSDLKKKCDLGFQSTNKECMLIWAGCRKCVPMTLTTRIRYALFRAIIHCYRAIREFFFGPNTGFNQAMERIYKSIAGTNEY